jgi:tetratricopeptide (TPR) repeat protein
MISHRVLTQESGQVMFWRFARFLVPSLLLAGGCLLTIPAFAQQPVPLSMKNGSDPPGNIGLSAAVMASSLEILLQGPDGNLVDKEAVVTLTDKTGKVYRQGTAKAGFAKFSDLAPSQYKILVLAPGFDREVVQVDAESKCESTITIRLREMPDEDAALTAGLETLNPKAQRELGKALALMHANKLIEAWARLETANRIAPNRAEVNYLFGLYFVQSRDYARAKLYWTRTLELNPQHLMALLSLGELFLQENKPTDALPYLKQAVDAEPTSWRAHAFVAEAEFREGLIEDAIEHAERAMDLGHGQAEKVRPLLAAALAKSGKGDQAIGLLQSYLKDHPGDDHATKQLRNLTAFSDSIGAGGSEKTSEGLADVALEEAVSLPELSNWRPADIDEKVPAVEAGPTCKLEDVLRETGKRTLEFMRSVDRFTATEFMTHESINKWGLPSTPEQRRFEYLVSIQEAPPGFLNVQEFRKSTTHSSTEFPDGVATNGLPALMLIFHPAYVGSFEFTCEGLTHSSSGLTWQVHFRQRSDKPNHIRAYRLGINGPSYPVALKGRAWIATDTFEVKRLETDMIAPIPEIRLFTDHTAVEYGPVHFKQRQVDLWLPKTAEVYYDWKGRRIHRQHNFKRYLLFAVDDTEADVDPRSAQGSSTVPDSRPATARP